MPRTPKITNQQILEAAREVFLEKGFSGATLEIATRAGVSEASIFKRFSTKEELFYAAMGISETPAWMKQLETLADRGDLKENLVQICLQILEFHREVVPQLIMLLSRGNSFPKPQDETHAPIRDVKRLTHFLEREMQQGRLRPCEPTTVAHILLGSLMNYVVTIEIYN
ncbi:MAG: TetR/AcrR family transcriptional regulator, partial [Scytonema sp. PMC 1069.18]|nr:TetR/AcrR family transcriptional regulator [Scytonema sp. PMC 1069.18]